MWACTPTSSTPGMQLERGHGLGGRARGHREAELGVLLPGAHELVGVRLDARGDPDQDRGAAPAGRRATRAGAPSRAISSKESTTMRPTPRSRAGGQLVGRLVVAVQDQPLGGHAGREGDVELAARRDVEVHALLVGQPGHGPAEEGLGGVGHAVAPGRRPPPGRRGAGGPRRRRTAACRTPAARSSRSMPPTRRCPFSSDLGRARQQVPLRAARSRRRGPSAWRCRIRQRPTTRGGRARPGRDVHGYDRAPARASHPPP